MWRLLLAVAAMVAITALLVRIGDTAEPQRATLAQQEANWAQQRAMAPFQLRLRRADGSMHQLAVGGPGWLVIQPERIEDFALAVGGDPAVYAPRAVPRLNWHIGVQVAKARDSGFALGRRIAWPGGDLREVTPADVRPFYQLGPLARGDLLGYAPGERLLVHCSSFGNCLTVFMAGRFQVRMVFHEPDRPLIRIIAADLRRCLPQWDGQLVEVVAPTPACA